MSFLQRLIGAGLRPHVRRKARGRALADVVAALESSRDDVLKPRLQRAKDTAGNREAVNHWLGIERWSLARVRVALGQPYLAGSYHRFRLPDDASWEQLVSAFMAARAETLELAAELDRTGFDAELTIEHNHLGPLTVLEWLVYIEDHSRREVIRLR